MGDGGRRPAAKPAKKREEIKLVEAKTGLKIIGEIP
jgi:hypothetical protein